MLLETLARVRHQFDGNDNLTLRSLAEMFGEEGRWVLTLFLALPFNQPIPLPGVSTPIGLLIALLGIGTALQKPLWLPQFVGEKKVAKKTFILILDTSEKLHRIASRFSRRRLSHVHRPIASHRFAGVCVLISGLLLSLPLPIPFSNFFPSLPISFFAFAFIFEDGLFYLIGVFLQAICLVFFGIMFWAPTLLVDVFRSYT